MSKDHGIYKTTLPLLCTLMISGCSFMNKDDNTLLIESLNQQPLPEIDTGSSITNPHGKAMESYEYLVELAPSHIMIPDARRRLADLQLEAAETQAYEGTDSAKKSGAADYGKAIAAYESLLQDFPDYEKNDEVLYQLSRAYELNLENDKALYTLDLIAEEHPESSHIIETQYRRGEALFTRKDYHEAASAYRAVVIAGSNTPFYEQALFKLGWSMYKQTRYREGLDAFTELLDYKLTKDGVSTSIDTLPRTEKEFLQDALRVVSMSFYYQAGAKSAADYFDKRGKRYYEDLVLKHLGDFYLGKERYSDAAKTYEVFITRNPYHIQAPHFQAKIIDTLRGGEFYQDLLNAKIALVQNYALENPFWKHHDPETAPGIMQHLKHNLKDLATIYHARAQRTHESADFDQAAHWYRSYINSFPDDSYAPQMNFLLAEIAVDTEQYHQAVIEFERTAYDYPEHDKSAEAAYAALLAYDRYGDKHATKLQDDELRRWQRRGIDSALRFTENYPDHPQNDAVLTRAAADLFSINELDMASHMASLIIERADTALPFRLTAWTILANTAFERGDYLAAESRYQNALSLISNDESETYQLSEKLAASIYKQAESSRAAGELSIAAEHFLRLAQAAPNSTFVAAAEFDAAAVLISLEDWGAAVTVLERFRTNFIGHELQDEVNRKLAVGYVKTHQKNKAAVEFERLSHQETDAEIQREALWQAGELYRDVGDQAHYLALLKDYVKRFPQPEDVAVEARQTLADENNKLGNTDSYIYWLKDIIKTYQDPKSAKSDRSRYLAASASLVLAKQTIDEYKKIKLVEPLDKNLLRKKNAMEVTFKAFEEAASYEVAEVTTAATHNIAEMYHDFSRAMLESERPVDLTALELEQYELLLEEQAYPFEEQAIDLYEINVHRTLLGIYDNWVKESYQKLGILLPARYSKTERMDNVVESIK